MEKSRGRLRLGLFLFLLLLLLPQASLGARSRLRILNLMDTSDEMQIECHDTNFKRPATFKLINPVNGTVVREVNNLTLIISVFPHNETVVRCQINGFEESESIAIAGRPQFTDRKLNTVQYVFSDNTDGVNFSCPLSEPGQLIGMPNFTPYEYEWFLNTRVRVATNALSDNNRTLHVHLPTSEPLEDYRFVCHADIRRCNSSSTNRCGAITTRNAMLYPSPPGFQVKIVDVNITVNPQTESVTQNDRAVFTCEATGFRAFDIKWEVDGMLYDREVCDDMENCAVTANEHTSTLELNTEHIEPNTLAIVCVVNPDKASLENDTTEIILPRITNRTMRHEGVQLEIMPRPPTTPATGPMSTSSTGLGSNELIITVVSIAFFFLLLLIIILAFCVVCIFRYYYKKYYGTLGRELTNNEPSSSHKNKPGHSHGIDLPSVHDTDAHINMGGIINHAGSASNGSDCISDVHTYSTISTVTNFDSTHHMPLQHIKISTDSQEESTGDAAIPPFGSSTIWQGDGVSMKKNESYRQTMAIHSIRNPSYGTNIAIAPWIDTKDNVAYKAAIDFDLHLETQV